MALVSALRAGLSLATIGNGAITITIWLVAVRRGCSTVTKSS
jgi:hypothetical protein